MLSTIFHYYSHKLYFAIITVLHIIADPYRLRQIGSNYDNSVVKCCTLKIPGGEGQEQFQVQARPCHGGLTPSAWTTLTLAPATQAAAAVTAGSGIAPRIV